jgi:hypothetical protein
METTYRHSEYGFQEIDRVCKPGKTIIELATLCVNGVYGATLVTEDGILYVIYDPDKTCLDGISRAIGHACHMVSPVIR